MLLFDETGIYAIKSKEEYEKTQIDLMNIKTKLDEKVMFLTEIINQKYGGDKRKTIKKVENACGDDDETMEIVKEAIEHAFPIAVFFVIEKEDLKPKELAYSLFEEFPFECSKKIAKAVLKTAKEVFKKIVKEHPEELREFKEISKEMARLLAEEEKQIVMPLVTANYPALTEIVRAITGFYKAKDIRYAFLTREQMKEMADIIERTAKETGDFFLASLTKSIKTTLTNLPKKVQDFIYREELDEI
jgi:hypothetical protein